MMSTVVLVRHGETDWNLAGRLQGQEDTELNETGIRQAKLCGAYLARESWDVILTSPFKRARKTADIIGQEVKIAPLVEVSDLRERDFGEASGLTHQEMALRFPDGRITGQEERLILARRAMGVLKYILRDYSGKKLVVVSHGGVINSILATLSRGEIGSGKTTLKNACLSRLVHDHGSWIIDTYNFTEHLHPAAK